MGAFNWRQDQVDAEFAGLADCRDERLFQAVLLGALMAGVDETTWQRSLEVARQQVGSGVRRG